MEQRKQQQCFDQLRIAFQIYKVTCPGCNEDYIGKTDRNLVTRLNEHASREDQHLYISTYQNVNTLHILLIYIDYQTLMLQQQRLITNNTLLTLLQLVPTVHQKSCTYN